MFPKQRAVSQESTLQCSHQLQTAYLPAAKRPRLDLVTCPICNRRLLLSLLDSHIDLCKPSSSPSSRLLQSSSTSLTQSFISPPPILHFLFSGHHSGRTTSPAVFCGSPCTSCTSGGSFSTQITLRNHPTLGSYSLLFLHACSAFTPAQIPPLPPYSQAALLPRSILLSALQKCVRRRLAYPAVRIAMAIIRKTSSLFELLRRLTVTMLEDAVLHPQVAEIVWLFAASAKDYQPSLIQIQFVLGVVYQIANCRIRDNGVWKDVEADSGKGGHLTEALRVRSCYGGMAGDVALFKRSAVLWGKRIEQRGDEWRRMLCACFDDNDAGVDINKMMQKDERVLRNGDIPLAAFDMHCCSVAEDVAKNLVKEGGEVLERFGGAGVGYEDVHRKISRMIWMYRSSVSGKSAWDGNLAAGWMVLEAPMRRNKTEGEDLNKALWRSDIEKRVDDWCRTYRRRFGL